MSDLSSSSLPLNTAQVLARLLACDKDLLAYANEASQGSVIRTPMQDALTKHNAATAQNALFVRRRYSPFAY